MFLEEAALLYRIVPVHIGRGEQFAPEFLRIARNNRIPAIVDHELAVVHAVLDTKRANGASDSDVKRAVAETKKVEERLSESAEKLEQVIETTSGREVRGAS